MASQCGVFIYIPLCYVLVIAIIQVFINSIVAVWVVIAHQLGVDADLGVVFCTFEEVGITAGQAAIARVTAGLSAVVRIPVVGAIVFSDECLEIFTVSYVIRVFVYFPRADGLIEFLHIFIFSTSLIDFEDTV